MIFARKTDMEAYCSGKRVDVFDGYPSDALEPEHMDKGHFLGSHIFNGKILGFDPGGSGGKEDWC